MKKIISSVLMGCLILGQSLPAYAVATPKVIPVVKLVTVKLPSPGETMAKAMDLLLINLQKKTSFSGSVILAQNGNVLLSKGYGMANEEYQIPNSPTTVFRLASLSKQLTAASVLKLVEMGSLKLSDPVSQYVPDFPRGNEITIQMLLNHTSGLRDQITQTGKTEEELTRVGHTPEELVSLIKKETLVTQPGVTYFYSNHGYILLGYCIEKASGMGYESFLKQAILEPLGIKEIQYDDSDAIVKNRAEGYKVVNGQKKKADWIDMSNPYAAGALIGTTESYLKWQQSYNSPKILSKESWTQFFGTQVKTNRTALFDERYALGVMTTMLPLNTGKMAQVIYHTGGVNGFRNFQIHIDQLNLDFILLSNNESTDLEPLLSKVLLYMMALI